jgi:hypothetical protein
MQPPVLCIIRSNCIMYCIMSYVFPIPGRVCVRCALLWRWLWLARGETSKAAARQEQRQGEGMRVAVRPARSPPPAVRTPQHHKQNRKEAAGHATTYTHLQKLLQSCKLAGQRYKGSWAALHGHNQRGRRIVLQQSRGKAPPWSHKWRTCHHHCNGPRANR